MNISINSWHYRIIHSTFHRYMPTTVCGYVAAFMASILSWLLAGFVTIGIFISFGVFPLIGLLSFFIDVGSKELAGSGRLMLMFSFFIVIIVATSIWSSNATKEIVEQYKDDRKKKICSTITYVK